MTYETSVTTTEAVLHDAPVSKQQRKGLFERLSYRWGNRTSPIPLHKSDSLDETETTDVYSDSDSMSCSSSSTYDSSDTLGVTYNRLPDNILHSLFNLISNKSLSMNRLGLQRLNLLISGRNSDSFNSKEIAPYVLILGGPTGSLEELLRFFFVEMICNIPANVHSYPSEDHDEMKYAVQRRVSQEEEGEYILDWILDGDESLSDDTILSDLAYDWERVKAHPQGKSEGALHNHALKIFANAICKIYGEDPDSLMEINLHSPLWRSIIESLTENIEMNHNVNATVHSMKILRILSLVQPTMVTPLLKYNLFPVLVDLKEYGQKQRLPVVSREASMLLKFPLS